MTGRLDDPQVELGMCGESRAGHVGARIVGGWAASTQRGTVRMKGDSTEGARLIVYPQHRLATISVSQAS